MCVVVGSRPLIPLMAGLHREHVYSGQGSGVALGGVAYSGALVARWRGMLRGRPAGAQPALPPAPRGRLCSPAWRGSGATAAAKLLPRSDTRLAGSPAQSLLRRQQRRRPIRLGRRRPCSRLLCRPDRERGEKKNAQCFFLKYEDPGRLRVDLNPLRTVERKRLFGVKYLNNLFFLICYRC